MAQSIPLFSRLMRAMFDEVSEQAVEEGLLTTTECDTIRRRGTRKQHNHIRHLKDLCAFVEYKQRKEKPEHDTERAGNLATVGKLQGIPGRGG
ncbi:unnamed protein product [marine sediment metagenome]|uniref:Uncharacterized protein n=1 Tax=marine sediment metagenome TaxID=412755 RepID=X1SRB4_9ZZZZ